MKKRLIKKSKLNSTNNVLLPTQIKERKDYYTRILNSKSYIRTPKRRKIEKTLKKLKQAQDKLIRDIFNDTNGA